MENEPTCSQLKKIGEAYDPNYEGEIVIHDGHFAEGYGTGIEVPLGDGNYISLHTTANPDKAKAVIEIIRNSSLPVIIDARR